MSVITYPQSSPYGLTPQSSWYIGRYVHRDILPASDDVKTAISSKYHLRPDKMAFDLYGSPVYWWVFMVRNMDAIRDPIWDHTAGKIIMVPSLAALQAQSFGG